MNITMKNIEPAPKFLLLLYKYTSIVFKIFFIIFLSGTALSSLFGPFALYRSAMDNFDNKVYNTSIKEFKSIVENYPNSRYAGDSLKSLAYSYYLDNNFENSIFYFKKAIDENIKRILKVQETIIDFLKEKNTADNVLKFLSEKYDLYVTVPQYFLNRSIVMAYLSHLKKEKKITCFIEGKELYWKIN